MTQAPTVARPALDDAPPPDPTRSGPAGWPLPARRRLPGAGDRYFSAYYPALVAILLDHQDKDGSWLSGNGNDRSGGRDDCTAMAVLALAVEYRYLPIYQR